MKTRKEKLHTFILLAIQLLGFMATGAMIPLFFMKGNLPFGKLMLLLLVCLAAVTVLYKLTVILHEVGHMIFGLLSGYEFSSFRIGSTLFVKKDGKLTVKRFNIPGTAGQCLMKPPADRENYSVIMYNLGGCLVNLIIAAAAAALAVVFKGSETLCFLLTVLATLNFTLGLSNILPLESGVATDGRNLHVLRTNPKDKKALWFQLYYNAHLSEGGYPSELGEEFITIPEDIDYTSPIQAGGVPVLRLSWLEQYGRYDEALLLCNELLEKGSFAAIQRLDLECEKVLLMLLTGKEKSEIVSVYTKELQQFTASVSNFFVSRQALLCGLSYLGMGNEQGIKGVLPIEKQLEQFEKVAAKYPYEGEAAICRKMLERFKEAPLE